MSNLRDRLTNTQDSGLHKFTGVIYGPAGIGKTTLARTLAPLGKTLIVSGEGGLASLSGYDLDVFEFSSLEDLSDLGNALVSGDLADYDALYVDSLTECGQIFDKAFHKRFAIYDTDLDLWEVPKANNFKYYGALGREKENFLRVIRDCGKHVFLSAKEKVWKNDKTGEQGVKPNFGAGSATDALPYLFDFVFAYRWMQDQEGADRRVLLTQEYQGWLAKARQDVQAPTLDPFVVDPDLSAIAAQSLPSLKK